MANGSLGKTWDADLVAAMRASAKGTEYPDSARECGWAADEIERLGQAVDELAAKVDAIAAERDEYARVALIGLAGLVGTPVNGYVKGGGPGQLAADFRRLREGVVGLQADLKRFTDADQD